MSKLRQWKRIETALFELDELGSRSLFRRYPIKSIKRILSRLGIGIAIRKDPDKSKLTAIAKSLEALIV